MSEENNPSPSMSDEIKQVGQEYLIPHDRSFASTFNAATRVFLSRYDEALKRSYKDAMAVRRDGLVRELLQGRKLPVKQLRWQIEPEDPKDRRQKRAAEQLEKIVRAIPRFKRLRGDLLEATYFGKAGAQLVYGYKDIDGIRRVTVTKHKPVNGDKFVHRFDGTPAVMINAQFRPEGATIVPTDRGLAMLLDKPYFRERFIIHEFEPTDTDFIHEGDMAEAVHGLGLRSWLWWLWYFRNEVLGWGLDALQKIGANGQYLGFVPSGNPNAVEAMYDALVKISRDNIAVLELNKIGVDGSAANSLIQRYEPSGIAYEVIMEFVQYFDDQMRRVVLGQNLSAQAAPTGMGSKVAEFHEDTLTQILASDAEDLDETLNEQLIPNLIKYNWGKLPFQLRYRSLINDNNVKDKIETAERLTAIGVKLDANDLREEAGFSAPKQDATTIGATQEEGGDGASLTAIRKPPVAGAALQRNARDRSLDPGMMICWLVPREVADLIAIKDGEAADQLHVTIAYLGRLSENPPDAIQWAEGAMQMAAHSPALGGRIAGIGRFPASVSSDGMDPLYADVDVRGLHELRRGLIDWLKLGEIAVRDDFAFHPHITLAYLDPTEKSPIDRLEPIPIRVDVLELWVGDQRIRMEMGRAVKSTEASNV